MTASHFRFIILTFFFICSYSQSWDSRDTWQKPDEILKAMGIKIGASVADIGCKDGYLTVKLAKAVGDLGTVYAIDIDSEALTDLQKNLDKYHLKNVTKVLSETDNPKLNEGSVDAVVILNAYHEMDEFPVLLKHIKKALKTNGRLVIVDGVSDSRRKSSRSIQTKKHELAIDFAVKDLKDAGFRIVERTEKFISNHPWRDEQWILVASPDLN